MRSTSIFLVSNYCQLRFLLSRVLVARSSHLAFLIFH
jgi:hypothetical protein